MQLLDLFEKRERVIYQLFLRVQDCSESFSLKRACQELNLSRSTLLRYLQSFSEEATATQIGLHFTVIEEEIACVRKAELSLQDLLAYLCQSSLKYQILVFFFEQSDCSLLEVAQTLLISEATLNRQLAALNKLLKTFEIGIRGGRMRGSELQIRYFYYQLYWQTLPVSACSRDRIYQEQVRNLPIFARFYQSHFNPRQAHQLALWLMIVHKRMRLKDLDFQSCYQLMKPYQQHKFYLQLRQLLLTVHQNLSFSFQEGDIQAVFAFVASQGILEAYQTEQLIGFGGPIMEATSWVYQQVKEILPINLVMAEGELYHLNQLFSHLYFFTAYLSDGIRGTLLEEDDRYQIASDMVQTVYRSIYQRQGSPALAHCQSLMNLFSYLLQVQPCQVQVALASSYSSVLSHPLFQYLQERLATRPWIVFEPFQADKTYDLIICHDYPMEGEGLYQLYGSVCKQDIVRLKDLLDLLHQGKKEKADWLHARSSFVPDRR